MIQIVQAALESAFDRIESGLPTTGVQYYRREQTKDTGIVYEDSALETIGFFLGVINVRFGLKGWNPECQEGIGIYDTLRMADEFDIKVKKLIEKCWEDEGKAIQEKMKKMKSFNSFDVLPFEIDFKKCAKIFVENLEKFEKEQTS